VTAELKASIYSNPHTGYLTTFFYKFAGVHHDVREVSEIADAKPSKGFIKPFGGFIVC
jgi:hypothetical protein